MNTSLLLIVLSAVLFGTAGISAKYLINTYSLSSFTIGALRLLIASPVLLMISKIQLKEKIRIERRHYVLFIVYGITVASYQIAYFTAVKNIMVSIATLIALCTAPIFVAILSRIFLKEEISVVVIFSLIISILGASLIIGIDGSLIWGDSNYLGYLLALAAGLSYAVYALCGKHLINYYPTIKVISLTFTLGALFILPFVEFPSNLPWMAWSVLLYLGVVPTALAYIIFTVGLKKSSATQASIATLFEPLTSTILSFLLLGEKFNLRQGLGAIFLSFALLLLVFNDYFTLTAEKFKLWILKPSVFDDQSEQQ